MSTMHWHWQNLSNRETSRGALARRRFPWNGRAWFAAGRQGPHHRDRRQMHVEWCVGHWWGFGAGIRLGPWGDEALNLHLFLGGLALFMAFDSMALYKRFSEGQRDREYEFNLFRDWDVRFKLGGSPLEWSRSQPWYWDWSLDLVDFVFGRTDCQTVEHDAFDIAVPMPERSYPARVKIQERIWRRKRWPWAWCRRVSADVDIPGGIPFPGKGENSWDCGMDGLFGMGSSHLEPAAIAADVRKSVLESRRRYAGSESWVPEPETA